MTRSNGHRTYIPNQFFTRLLPNEPLAVLKVVGAVIRFSIGFEVKRGFRRQQAALSYADLQRYSNIVGRHHLSSALRSAIASNYIVCIERGVFDPNAGQASRAAVYGLKWAAQNGHAGQSGSERFPDADRSVTATGSRRLPTTRFNKVPESGLIEAPERRFKKVTGTEIKPESTTPQQQQPAAAGKSDNDNPLAYRRLRAVGFDEAAAKRLASVHPLELVERQIAWMGKRHAARNPLGMLRKAIEEDWPAPANLAEDVRSEESPAMVFARHFYAGGANDEHPPVALPSSADLAAAAPLVRALLSIWPDTAQARRWARQFANHAAERQRPHQPPMSLSLAARLFGDGFVVWMGRDREREARQSASAQREADETRFKADYLRYLRATEERLRERDPVRHRAFVDHREQRRRSLLRVTRNGVQSALLRGFETEAARLEDFREFFSSEVLDFARWHVQHNQKGATA